MGWAALGVVAVSALRTSFGVVNLGSADPVAMSPNLFGSKTFAATKGACAGVSEIAWEGAVLAAAVPEARKISGTAAAVTSFGILFIASPVL